MPEAAESTKQGYLTDPNYYRLGYQLAAQSMHREETDAGRALPEENADIVYEKDVEMPSSYRAGAEREAERFIADAENTLERLHDERERKRWGLFRRRPTPKEERLDKFLRRTVIPCLTIIIAAAVRPADLARAEATIAPLRRRADGRWSAAGGGDGISYRALYNLACYETGEDGKAGRAAVLDYLARALDQAPGSRRQELGRWARKDPSFANLQEDPAFKELLEPYKSCQGGTR